MAAVEGNHIPVQQAVHQNDNATQPAAKQKVGMIA